MTVTTSDSMIPLTGIESGSLKFDVLGATMRRVQEDVTIFGVKIPAGYLTDGASVPRRLQGIIPRFGKALPAALVHDIRYDPPDRVRRLSRKEADREFFANLKRCGLNFAQRHAAYRAVRLFGGIPWRRGAINHTAEYAR